MKEFSKFQVATIKRVAQSVSPLVRIKERLTKEINEREKELASIQIQIDAFQGPIKEMTGGFSSEDLVTRVVETTDKVDKDGKPVKVTKWVLKYPDTIIPVMEEPAVNEPVIVEQTAIQEEPVRDNTGSDFDIDFTVPEPNFQDI